MNREKAQKKFQKLHKSVELCLKGLAEVRVEIAQQPLNYVVIALITKVETELYSMTETLIQFANENPDFEEQAMALRKKIFGSLSEKRVVRESADAQETETKSVEAEPAEKAPKTAKRDPQDNQWVNASGLRYKKDVEVVEIIVSDPAVEGLSVDEYEKIGEEITCKLATRSKYYIKKYIRPKHKHKLTGEITIAPPEEQLIPNSQVDSTFVVHMILDKFLYHLPLHRQHQQIERSGIKISRGVLTKYFQSGVDLLKPIYKAQKQSILESKVIAMDETWLKVRFQDKKKMSQSCFWPVFGDKQEICFEWQESRQHKHVEEILGKYGGILLTDGFAAYEKYAEKMTDVIQARCWSHGRRHFMESLPYEAEDSEKVLDYFGKLYQNEENIRKQKLDLKQKAEYRLEHSKPVVDALFALLHELSASKVFLPSNKFAKAIEYMLSAEKPLRVFLHYPEVAIDTNHVERENCAVALGRKNWLFCWTEVGAEYVGIVMSLLRTCLLHHADPVNYLLDVFKKIDEVKIQDVAELTPRIWASKQASHEAASIN